MEKATLRKELRAQAAALPKDYCLQADDAIRRQVLALPQLQSADTVFCFVGHGTEIDTMPLLADILRLGKRLCLPRCLTATQMEAFAIDDLNLLAPGRFGIPEPPEEELVLPAEIDFAILPCLSADPKGYRLGQGAGYYDRYLVGTSFPTCVVCRRPLMRPSLPILPHDRPADIVITD